MRSNGVLAWFSVGTQAPSKRAFPLAAGRGRSLFRDKRIPRENLNGLLIERRGMSAVLYHLGGLGRPQTQDSPYYSEVMAFETWDTLDWSHTRLTRWHGWQHDRSVYFYHHGGPILVVDAAEGPPNK